MLLVTLHYAPYTRYFVFSSFHKTIELKK